MVFNRIKKQVFVSLLLLLVCSSCYEDVIHEEIEETSEEQIKQINNWVYNTMAIYYYWNNEMPDSLDYSLSPVIFFNSLLSSKDKFSWIINSKQDNLNRLQGIRKNYGFEYILGYADNSQNNLLGVVLYTHVEAEKKNVGIKRGDIFYEINNMKITIENYEDLLASEKADFLFHRYTNDSSFVKELNAVDLKINPIQITKVYSIENKKIGYICYNQFISDNGDGSNKYKYDLLHCFEYFQNEQINELVIDFRYNPGGLIDLSVLFSSLIVPDTTQIAMRIDYNNRLNELYHKQGMNLDLKFDSYPQSYIGGQLKRVFFIISTSTASASEAVINTLLPYMEVILIGGKTYGKNYGSVMFTDHYNYENTWAIQPIILKILNSRYKSDYDNGFNPNYNFNEFSSPLMELGSLEEPLLNIAISIINNSSKSKGYTRHLISSIEYNSLKQIQSLPVMLISN
jgi:C-terminal processing protease CtpA/Prc